MSVKIYKFPIKKEVAQNYNSLSEKAIVYLGNLAIKPEILGINDPVTHLYCCLDRKNNQSLIDKKIEEDIVTDIAERLSKKPFVNNVGFTFTGNDFVSLKDKASLVEVTNNNLQRFKDIATDNLKLGDELKRAELEAAEPSKIAEWFKGAKAGSYLIFESLPMGDQVYAVSRIFRKVNNNLLEGCFISLHNPSVNIFNDLRKDLGAKTNLCVNELQILQNCYEFYDEVLTSPEKFIEHYVGAYDNLLKQKYGKDFKFGLDGKDKKENSIETVRAQSNFTSIYLDTIKAFVAGKGLITEDIMYINQKLGINYPLIENQPVTIDMAGSFLGEVIFSITSAIDRVSEDVLQDLQNLAFISSNQGASYDAANYYADQARADGQVYKNPNCSAYDRLTQAGSETKVIFQSYGTRVVDGVNIKNFGKEKVGVCRVQNCTSRGEWQWWPDKTLVGGCDICVCCHLKFRQGQTLREINNYYKNIRRQTKMKKAAKTIKNAEQN